MLEKNNNIHTSGWSFAILTFFLFGVSLSNCNNTPTPPKDLSQLEWLLGEWEVDDGASYETWTKVNDQFYLGRNFTIYNQADTLIKQNIRLVIKNNEIFYTPTVKTPAGDLEVPFKLVSNSTKNFVFENAENNFPSKITYTKIDSNSAKTRVEGGKRKVNAQYIRKK